MGSVKVAVVAGLAGVLAKPATVGGVRVAKYVRRASRGDIMRWFGTSYYKMSNPQKAAVRSSYAKHRDLLVSAFGPQLAPLTHLSLKDGVVKGWKMSQSDEGNQLLIRVIVPGVESSFTRVWLRYSNARIVGGALPSRVPASFVLGSEVDFGFRRRLVHRLCFENNTQIGVEFSGFAIEYSPADLEDYVAP